MKHWKVTLGTGLAWTQSYKVEAANETEALDIVADKVEAANETEALDIVADKLEEEGLEGLYTDYYGLADEAETGQTADEYAEANGLVCCGNHGIYVQLLGIEEV